MARFHNLPKKTITMNCGSHRRQKMTEILKTQWVKTPSWSTGQKSFSFVNYHSRIVNMAQPPRSIAYKNSMGSLKITCKKTTRTVEIARGSGISWWPWPISLTYKRRMWRPRNPMTMSPGTEPAVGELAPWLPPCCEKILNYPKYYVWS